MCCQFSIRIHRADVSCRARGHAGRKKVRRGARGEGTATAVGAVEARLSCNSETHHPHPLKSRRSPQNGTLDWISMPDSSVTARLTHTQSLPSFSSFRHPRHRARHRPAASASQPRYRLREFGVCHSISASPRWPRFFCFVAKTGTRRKAQVDTLVAIRMIERGPRERIEHAL